MTLIDDLVFYNPWWTENRVPQRLLQPFKRNAFEELLKYFDTGRIIVLKGARRTGKSTLAYQLIEHMLEKKVAPKNILYVSFDDLKMQVSLHEILEEYERQVLKAPLENERTIVFMDEVQFKENWELETKKFFDRKYPITFFATGSAATFIKKSSESLAGRTIELSLPPFSFKEFFEYSTGSKLKINARDIIQVKNVEKKAELLFNEYVLKGGFPSTFGLPDELWRKTVREDVVEKAVYRDIATLYDVKNPQALEKLLLWIASNTGGLFNKTALASEIGLSREYVDVYLHYLKNAYLVKTIPAFTASAASSIRKNEKAYVTDTGVANALTNSPSVIDGKAGMLVETIIANELDQPAYLPGTKEVDFISGKHAIEVKYQRNVSDSEVISVARSAAKARKKPLIITRNIFEERFGTQLVPAWLYLLCKEAFEK